MRCLKKELYFSQFKLHVKQLQNVEKYIAIKNQKLSKHNKKWFVQESDTVKDNMNDYVHKYLEAM